MSDGTLAWVWDAVPFAPTPLENATAVADLVGTFVSATAVIVGGAWAYFRFVRNRTYQPRVESSIAGGWVDSAGAKRLHVTLTVKNIGAAKVTLVQKGTGLGLDTLRVGAGSDIQWEEGPVLSVFPGQAYVEPGETIVDDLIAPVAFEGRPIRAQLRLVWRWGGGRDNIEMLPNRIIWPPDEEPEPDIGDRGGGRDGDT